MSTTNRPRVYLVHGLLESAAGYYASQIVALRDRYDFIPVDLPGHGRCPLDAVDGFYDRAAEYLEGVLSRFGVGHLAAASYIGSPVAVRVATRRPDLVRSLVLQGFIPGLDHTTFAAWMNGFEHLAMLAEYHLELERGYTAVHGSRWRQTVSSVLTDVERHYDTKVCVNWEVIGRLPMPVLLVNGSVRTVEREAARHAFRWGPRVTGVVIAEAGHLPGRQRPREFNATVMKFWRMLDEQE